MEMTTTGTSEDNTLPSNLSDPKWKIAYICMLFRFFLDGCERSIVLPNIWNYVKEHGANETYVGYVFMAHGLSGLISAITLGPFVDRFGYGRVVLTIFAATSILGNLIYVIAPSRHWITFGRFLAGFIVEPIVLGELGRAFLGRVRSDKQGKAIAHLYTIQQLGYLVGITSTIFAWSVKKSTWRFGWFGEVNLSRNNFPSLILAILYLISTLLFLCKYDIQHLTEVSRKKQVDGRLLSNYSEQYSNSDVIVQSSASNISFYDVFRSYPFLTAVSIGFIDSFIWGITTGYATQYLTDRRFWDERDLAIFFTVCSVVATIMAAIISNCFADYFQPRTILIAGVVGRLMCQSGLFCVAIFNKQTGEGGSTTEENMDLSYFFGYAFFQILDFCASAAMFISAAIITTSSTPRCFQSSAHSVSNVIKFIATSLGPLYGSHVYSGLGLTYVYVLPMAFGIISLSTLISWWKKLHRKNFDEMTSTAQ